jgi:hypothetical protein
VKGGVNRHRVRVQMPQKRLLFRPTALGSKPGSCDKPIIQKFSPTRCAL